MKVRDFFSIVLTSTLQLKTHFFIVPVLALILFAAFPVIAQDPVLKVKFANPTYDCATHIYRVNVRFQSNTPNLQLFGINVRFYYPDDILEFISFGDFISGYAPVSPNPPLVQTGNESSGMALFGFPGPSEYINGAVQKIAETPVTIIPTNSSIKLFNVSFYVEDTAAFNIGSFCPGLIWDLEEDPANGGFQGGSEGVVMTVVTTYPNSGPTTENVIQFNWQYDGVPGLPYGFPVNSICINTICAYAPDTYLPSFGAGTPGMINIPVSVVNFDNIGALTLAFEYDPCVMTYVSYTPNPIFNTSNGLLTVTDAVSAGGKKKISLNHQGTHAISLSDDSYLANLSFNYISGTTDLTWITDGNSCEYADSNNIPVYDLPFPDYYINGIAYSSLAPSTKIDSTVAIVGEYVTYTVNVWNYSDINSGVLTLSYNPGVLAFDAILPNDAIDGTFEVDALIPGILEMNWDGNDTCLADGSALMYVTFQYLGGSTPLSWFDNGLSCHYTNIHIETPLNDIPSENFYTNGNIANSVVTWTGGNSGDWNSAGNWVNNSIPDQFTNVTLDPSVTPLYWPTYNGNFTLGEDCQNLTLIGDARLTINGDLSIGPGHILALNGSGILQVSGDWINSGTFIPGTGVVDFTGNADGTINEGVPPGNFIAGYIHSTFTGGMVPITGGTAGPTGNDAHSDVDIGFVFNYLGIDYSQVRINTNGWLSLNLSGPDGESADNIALFNTSSPTTVLAPWWDDLLADAGTTIKYLTEGTSPFRILTVEWNDILAYSSGASTRLNFQVKLYESDNIIDYCYGSVSGGTHNPSESASIGIKDAIGGPGNFIEATQNSIYIMLAVLESNSDWPALNYRFIPPVENEQDIFYKIVVSKPAGNLNIARDIKITGLD